MHLAHVIAEISWDPAIRNILALMVGIGVLMGSVVLIVSTNAGPRTGLLVVLGCLFGWMTIMGVVWWMYGIGMKGDPSHWRAIEVNRGNLAQSQLAQATKLPQFDDPGLAQKILQDHPELEKKVNPDGTPDKVITVSELIDADPTLKDQYHLTPNDLGGWRILVPSDKQRGDAQAIADETLTTPGPNLVFKDSSQYKVIDAFDIGGKRQLPATVGDCKFYKPSTWGDCKEHAWDDIYSFVQFSHPEHYAMVQVQAVIPQVTPPGAAPPTPKLDPNAPVISVIMIRSLGDLRFPAFMVTLVFGILFFLTCWTLHRRDKIIAANRSAG
jgi:hypothetical protein